MQSRSAQALFALAFVLVTVAVASCSNSSDSTSPTPPVTGPTFSFGFPAAGTPAVPGTSNKRIFPVGEEGTWTYHCIPHSSSGMTGTITVAAAAPADSAFVQVGAGGANVFSPATVSIKPGGYVRWANVSALTIHTATRP